MVALRLIPSLKQWNEHRGYLYGNDRQFKLSRNMYKYLGVAMVIILLSE